MTTHPAPSHFFPLLPLARALETAGHQVAFASSAEFGPVIQKLGFRAYAGEPDWSTDPRVSVVAAAHKDHIGPDHAVFALQELFIRAAGIGSLPLMETVFSEYQPDVVITEVTEFAGGSVAEKLGIPAGIVSFGLDLARELAPMLLGSAWEELRAAAGLAPDPEFLALGRSLRLCFAPRSYQPEGIPLSPVTHVLRPTLFDRPENEELPDWLSSLPDRPTVYGTLGTVFADSPGIFEAILDGLAGEPVNVILTVSRDRDPVPLRKRAENARVEQYIPNSLLLPRCDVLVAHAGYGTVMGGLAHGLPMLLLPLGADQFMHADRCVTLGLAQSLLQDAISPETVRSAVGALLAEGSYRERAVQMRDELESMPGVETAVGLVERLARTGQPVLREV